MALIRASKIAGKIDEWDQPVSSINGVCNSLNSFFNHLRDMNEQQRKLFDESIDGVGLADAETGIRKGCNNALAGYFAILLSVSGQRRR